MKKEIGKIIYALREVLYGEPWYGQSFFAIAKDIDLAIVFERPNGQHSLTDLLYHMITWSEFTENIFDETKLKSVKSFEDLDWRTINPDVHSWEKGLEIFKTVNENIITQLLTKDDLFLETPVDDRTYNVQFLLNGLIQHHIYHLGQIAYIKKLLS
ncbi:MAG: DinB family protein [Bacteroidetes bacterium]|nr:DinB family protein [Bacteroidota bacterium]MBS1933376.1 DinB family protein [Bacteroidota bacterium]